MEVPEKETHWPQLKLFQKVQRQRMKLKSFRLINWWGITAQTKLVIDKCYCRGAQIKGKKIGVLVPGGSPVDATQYELIKKQFECMASYLDWNMLFYKPFYAPEKDAIKNNADLVKELKELGSSL